MAMPRVVLDNHQERTRELDGRMLGWLLWMAKSNASRSEACVILMAKWFMDGEPSIMLGAGDSSHNAILRSRVVQVFAGITGNPSDLKKMYLVLLVPTPDVHQWYGTTRGSYVRHSSNHHQDQGEAELWILSAKCTWCRHRP